MRKWKIVVSVIVVIAAAALGYVLGYTMAKGGEKPEEELTFYAEITDIGGIEGTYFTVRGLEVNDVNFRGDFTLSVTEDTEIEWNFMEIVPKQLQVGNSIAVTFSGDIQESDPAQIGNVTKIRLLEDEVEPLPKQEEEQSMMDAKPVIYLYPQEDMKISVKLEEVTQRLPEILEAVQQGLYDKAKKNLEEHTYVAHSIEEAKELQETNGGFIKTMWCGDLQCELDMKEKAGMSSRCIPFQQEKLDEVLDQFLNTKGCCLLICEVHPDVGTND